MTTPKTTFGGRTRWSWVLLAGAAVGAAPYLFSLLVIYGYAFAVLLGEDSVSPGERERIVFLGYAAGLWVSPVLHLLLAAYCGSWVARRAGSAALRHGLLVGAASVAANLGLDVAFYPPLSQAATYACLGIGGGLLGGLRARSAIAAREALYEASRNVSRAENRTRGRSPSPSVSVSERD